MKGLRENYMNIQKVKLPPRRLQNYGLTIGLSITLVILTITLVILIVHLIQFKREERKSPGNTTNEKKEKGKKESPQCENIETNNQGIDAQSEEKEEEAIAVTTMENVWNDKQNRGFLICFTLFFLILLAVIWFIIRVSSEAPDF